MCPSRRTGVDAGDLAPDVNARVTLRFGHTVRMLGGNTARLTVQVEGATKVVAVLSGAPGNVLTTFSGFLVGTG